MKKVKQPESETFFEAVFQNSMDGILISAPDGSILAANPVACRMLGRSEAEIIKLGRTGMIDPADGRIPRLLAERERSGKARGVIRMIRKDGSLFTAEFSSKGYTTEDGNPRSVVIIRDITEELIAKDLRISTIEILSIFNNTINKHDLIKSITEFLRNALKYEAVGIRLKEGADYPYFQSGGFPQSFIASENFLCVNSKEGTPGLDFNADPVYECMCGNVIQSRIDQTKPFFTSHGSFWTNSTTELLKTTTVEDGQSRIRNRCNSEGYESVGLFPLRTNNKTFGLLQVNDKRKGMFSPEKISFFETLGDNLAIALDKYLTAEALIQSEAHSRLMRVQLERAELLMRSVLSNAPVTIFATDNKGIFTLSEGRELAKTGLRPGEIVGDSAYKMYESLSFFENTGNKITGKVALDRALSGEILTLANELNGVYFENHIAPITNENGEVTGVVGLAVNITDRKVLEMSLRKSEVRYRMLFNHSTIPIWEADFSRVKEYLENLKKGEVRDFLSFFMENPEKTVYCISLVKITGLNLAALNYFGVKNTSDITLRLPKLFTNKSVVIFAELLASLAEGRRQSERDIPLRTLDGKSRYMNLRLQVMPDSFFSLSRVIVTWIDISDRMNYEENLKQSSEALRELNRHIEEARENERIKISLNLHDDLGQKLTAIKMDISWLKARIGVQSPLVVNKLTGIFGMIDDTVETVRNISADLWPGMLYDLGLKTAVEWQLEQFTRNTGIKCNFIILPPELQVEDKLSIILYRIIQESLTNVSRHSKAKKVWISMESDNNHLMLTVRDNGIGIEKDKITDPKSFGLMGLKERARAYGGELKITGKKGVGTTVHAVIPLDVGV